jgi:hypothetical protein
MIMGSGRVSLLSDRTWLNGSDLAPLRGAHPRIYWATTPAIWAAQDARAGSPVGPRRKFGPKAEFK